MFRRLYILWGICATAGPRIAHSRVGPEEIACLERSGRSGVVCGAPAARERGCRGPGPNGSRRPVAPPPRAEGMSAPLRIALAGASVVAATLSYWSREPEGWAGDCLHAGVHCHCCGPDTPQRRHVPGHSHHPPEVLPSALRPVVNPGQPDGSLPGTSVRRNSAHAGTGTWASPQPPNRPLPPAVRLWP